MQTNDTSHSQPNAQSENCHPEKREVHGKIEVHGGFEANFPPSLINTYKANNESTERWEKKKFRLEISTLLFVVFAAVFTGIQSYQSVKATNAAVDSAKAAKDAADVARCALELSVKEFASSQAAVLQPHVATRNVPTGKAITLKGNAPIGEMEAFIQVDIINAGKVPATHVSGVITTRHFGKIELRDVTISAQNPSPEYQSGFISRRFRVGVYSGPFFGSESIKNERMNISLSYFNGIENITDSYCYTVSQQNSYSGLQWEDCDQQ